jgi:molybdenum cofactor biosynthesis enzyme MoaA
MTFKNTFCAAPWFQARIDWNGAYRPCCELNESNSTFAGRTEYSLSDTTIDEWMSSDYSQYLRKELSNGARLPECNKCWQKEKNNVKSLRQYTNDTATNNQGNNLDHTWVKIFVARSQDYKDYRLLSADVKLSNVCNFSCVMCGPHDSSKLYNEWKSELDNKFVQEKLQTYPTYFEDIVTNYQTQRGYQHLTDILTHPIRHLKVLGGEPLLDKELFKILQNQPLDKKSQIHIHMVTNGSQDIVEAVDRLKDYKSVSFTISLEGVGNLQDYSRNGSHWPTVEKNILDAKKNNILISINHTLQALTVLNLSELLLWCQHNQIQISFGILENPNYLSISVLPTHIRQIAIDNLSKIQDITIINSLDNQLLSINSIKELINQFPIDSEKYTKFLEYISWFERKSSAKLRDLQPVFYAG